MNILYFKIQKINNFIQFKACLRSDTYEQYWNGSTCIDALNYDQICTNSSSNEECKYMTQGTFCGGSVPHKCKCLPSKYYNIVNQKCENLLSIYEACTQVDACKTGHCYGLICQCLATEYYDYALKKCCKFIG